MVDFLKIRKKRPFSERLSMIAYLVNKQGKVSVKDLVLNWDCTPHYCRTLLQWAAEKYPYTKFDDATDELYIIGREDKNMKNEEVDKIE